MNRECLLKAIKSKEALRIRAKNKSQSRSVYFDSSSYIYRPSSLLFLTKTLGGDFLDLFLFFMGVSNSEILDLTSLEIDLLVNPTLKFQDHECEIGPHQMKQDEDDDDQDQDQGEGEGEEEDKYKIMVASLKIKIPSSEEIEIKDEEEEYFDSGFKTPTTFDQKTPVVLQCPAAPKKPKIRPLLTKRKEMKILYDLSNEIDALFPPALLADIGNKSKKPRSEN